MNATEEQIAAFEKACRAVGAKWKEGSLEKMIGKFSKTDVRAASDILKGMHGSAEYTIRKLWKNWGL